MILSGSAVQVKGFGISVCALDEAVDGGLKIDNRSEDATFEPAFGEGGEVTLNGVQPRA